MSLCRLLKDKRGMDESFNKFLEMKRGAAMHTLESLMLLPVRVLCLVAKVLQGHTWLVSAYKGKTGTLEVLMCW